MKKLLFSLFISLLFIPSVKGFSAMYGNFGFSFDDNPNLPLFFYVNANTTYSPPVYVYTYDSNTKLPYLEMMFCSTGDFEVTVTNYGYNSYFTDYVELVHLQERSCNIGDYVGSYYLVQLNVGKYSSLDDAGEYMVSSNINFINNNNYMLSVQLQNVFLTDENMLLDYNENDFEDALGGLEQNQQETNDKLDDLKEEEEETQGILGNIIDTITGIPQTIANFFTEALQYLFIPTEEQFEDLIDKSQELSEDFGFVGQSYSYAVDFLNAAISGLRTRNPDPIQFPGLTIGDTTLFDGFTIIPQQYIDIEENELLYGQGNNSYTIRRNITNFTSILLIGLFISWGFKEYYRIMSKQTIVDDGVEASGNLASNIAGDVRERYNQESRLRYLNNKRQRNI